MGNVLRIELAPLGVDVITVMSGGVASAASQTAQRRGPNVPDQSLYRQLAQSIEANEAGRSIKSTEPAEYSKQVADDLLGKRPRLLIWRGAFAWLAWVFTWLGWVGILDGGHAKKALLNKVQRPRLLSSGR